MRYEHPRQAEARRDKATRHYFELLAVHLEARDALVVAAVKHDVVENDETRKGLKFQVARYLATADELRRIYNEEIRK